MGASKKIKMILLDKGMNIGTLAEEYSSQPRILKDGTSVERSGSKQTLYNMMSRDAMTFATVEQLAEILGCEVVFRDKESGKIY